MIAMAEYRLQALIDAPVDVVWKLAADPERQTEWWPDSLVWESGELELGCRVRHVAKRPGPLPDLETTLQVERFTDCEELLVRCMDTGTFTYARLTEAQGATFIEMVAGNEPKKLDMRIFNATIGKRIFRRWVEHAIDRLRAAAEAEATVSA
jgi:uncharacterized protein YndB with AHSA1/START domain